MVLWADGFWFWIRMYSREDWVVGGGGKRSYKWLFGLGGGFRECCSATRIFGLHIGFRTQDSGARGGATYCDLICGVCIGV